jgi:SAM-dependent methyltransferase
LSIRDTCDFCGVPTLEHVYTPINSARGMEVFVCGRCGLVQSLSTAKYRSRPPGSMSADADRSSYRYTKDVISDRYEECFTQFIDFSGIADVLDVGSNRGAFIKYLETHYRGKRIVGIEPDPTVITSYASLPNVSVQTCRFEHAQLTENRFDFSYCAHTLEHADSAREMLLGIRRALKPGGLLFVAVPNLIFYSGIIEEIFIDPHTYHFDFHLLKDFASQIGFTVEYAGKPSAPELMLLLRKSDDDTSSWSFIPANPSQAAAAKAEIRRYADDIRHNRAALKVSARRLNEVGVHQQVVVWGGGRILDALVRFGGLDTSKISLIVDRYLHRYVKTLHGCRLCSPDALRHEARGPIVVYIASREYADEIRAEAEAMGITQFIQFGRDD